jgi:transposase InsO family protein
LQGRALAQDGQAGIYQLLAYTGDIDLHRQLADWERFYNLSRLHGAFNGKAPYEALRERL